MHEEGEEEEEGEEGEEEDEEEFPALVSGREIIYVVEDTHNRMQLYMLCKRYLLEIV